MYQGPTMGVLPQPTYYQPTPPYYNQSEVHPAPAYPPKGPPSHPQLYQQQQQHHGHNHGHGHGQPLDYLATPSSSLPHLQHQQQQQQLQQPAPLAINTKSVPPPSSSSSSATSRKQHQHQHQTVNQLAEFAAHMVCYLLYGHQSSSKQNAHLSGSPPASNPSSPLPGAPGSHSGSGSVSACSCSRCQDNQTYAEHPSSSSFSQTRSSWLPLSASSTPSTSTTRPTHRRILSESDIVQPKPMFRKFCLDVLSATLLSPSVILLSLKYIQKLMVNLKNSNKIVNTGDGAEYRFFTGALILANKFLDDNTFTNKTWADITGMRIKDVNHLEMQFLNGIDFRLFTSLDEYSEWLASLTQFTGKYMPSQWHVAYQQQASAAQSPISPMDPTPAPAINTGSPMTPTDNASLGRTLTGASHVGGAGSGSGSGFGNCSSHAYSMASINHYIESVKIHRQNQQQRAFQGRYQRVPSTLHPTSTSTTPNQRQTYVSLPPLAPAHQESSPYSSYPQGPTGPIHRKRSANIAFEDTIDRSPCYEPGPPTSSVVVRTHKRYSSSSSSTALVGLGPNQEMFHAGHSPLRQHQQQPQQQQQRSQPSFPPLHHRSSSGSMSSSFRGQHQRSSSGSYYVDMTGYSASTPVYGQDPSQAAPMSLPSSFLRSGAPVHPLDERESSYRPPVFGHSRSRSQVYYPATPPHYSPNKYDSPCQDLACGSGMNSGPVAYEMDPRLWGPLDSISLYAITTQAAKRVMAQSKALSASTNGLHMYYPTTLA